MNILRTFIFYFFFITTIPVEAFIMRVFPKLSSRFDAFKLCSRWGALMNWILKTACGVQIKVKGNVSPDPAPALLVCNHTGPWETVGFMPFYPLPLTYVIKKQLMSWKYSLYSMGLKALNPIPISREANSGDFQMIRELSAKHFSQGHHVLIFPGGTRAPLRESIPFPPTGILLAKKLKCRVIPVFIDSEPWSRGKLIKDWGMIYPGTITISFGEPVSADLISSNPVKEIHQSLMGFFEKELADLDRSR